MRHPGQALLRPRSARTWGKAAITAGIVTAASFGAAGIVNAAPALAVDPVFDASRLHEVRIEISPADWETLRRNYQENTYYRAVVTLDGERVADVGIRSRGNGTRNPVKPSLKLDFNEYVSAQRFHGYKAVNLENLYGDASGIHEHLSFAVFEAVGIPAPANSFGRGYVNGEYWGLYEVVEDVEDRFLKDRYPPGKSTLYKFEVGVGPWDLSWRGEDPAAYIPGTFEPKTNEKTLDPAPLLQLIRTVNQAPHETFLEELGRSLDVRTYLTFLAVENAVAEVDGQGGFLGINNFYLYQLDGSSRFAFIPWDNDFTFVRPDHDVAFGIERNLLVGRLLTDRSALSIYRSILQDVVRRYVNERWLLPRAQSAYALIRESMREDRRKRGGDLPDLGNADFEAAVQQVFAVVGGRASSVFAQAPGPWVLPSAASVRGASGSRYTTDVSISSTGETFYRPPDGKDVAQETLLTYSPRGGAPRKAVAALGPGWTTTFADVVGRLFGAPDTYGPIYVEAGWVGLDLRAVTSTPGDEGTYGQGVPFFGAERLASSVAPCVIAGVSDGPLTRSNLILASGAPDAASAPSPSETAVDVVLRSGQGTVVGSTRVSLPPGGLVQIDRVARTLGGGDGDVGSLTLSTPDPTGLYAAYVARIDERTNDPRTLLPVCAPSRDLLVPAAAHAGGALGAFFTTALVLTNPGPEEGSAALRFLGHDHDGTIGPISEVTVQPGATVRVEDVLGTRFGIGSGYGALAVAATTPLVVSAETSTPSPRGGTYGQTVPAFSAADRATPDAPARFPGIRDDDGFRTNLVLASGSAQEASATVKLYRASGELVGERTFTLPPFGMTQLSTVGRQLSGGPLVHGRLVVSVAGPDASLAVHASEIDASTNDPRTLLPR